MLTSSSSLLSDDDLFLFNQGQHVQLHNHLGAHITANGVWFGVWAPNAHAVSVIGEFNGWTPGAHPMAMRGTSGIWEAEVAHALQGHLYQYHVQHAHGHSNRADPMGFAHEVAPDRASRVCALEYTWSDQAWMNQRDGDLNVPINTYELHAGSWKRRDGVPLSYDELARELVPYMLEMGYTHVELLPITAHPFYGSWGYQTTGYFAPTGRYGTPQQFMEFVDTLHQAGIGVILDWVPSHFPEDDWALAKFDGTHLYEHEDPRKGFHPDWKSCIFNYERHEVRSFLISSALFWIERYHIDALRVDAVASMLYLDYSRGEGEWEPNEHGGRENLGAVEFIKQLNATIHQRCPGVWTIAEESTAWPGVTRPIDQGGLGFDMKWDMGWMNDTLTYLQRDPIHRAHHHDELTFRYMYGHSEHYVLSLSHDEVVHGKGSLLQKMAGDQWQQLANLRLLSAYMHALPGKTLVFMGQEFGQWREWAHERSLDWDLLDEPGHHGLQTWNKALNHFSMASPPMHQRDFDPGGFQWVRGDDASHSTLSFLRWGMGPEDVVLIVFNFTPEPRYDVRLGVPKKGHWRIALNSDDELYGGSQVEQWIEHDPDHPSHGFEHSVRVTLPPLGALFISMNEHSR